MATVAIVKYPMSKYTVYKQIDTRTHTHIYTHTRDKDWPPLTNTAHILCISRFYMMCNQCGYIRACCLRGVCCWGKEELLAGSQCSNRKLLPGIEREGSGKIQCAHALSTFLQVIESGNSLFVIVTPLYIKVVVTGYFIIICVTVVEPTVRHYNITSCYSVMNIVPTHPQVDLLHPLLPQLRQIGNSGHCASYTI